MDRETILIEFRGDGKDYGRVDRVIGSRDALGFWGELEGYLRESYDSENGVNRGLCSGLMKVFTLEYVVEVVDFMLIVMEKSSDLVIGQLGVKEIGDDVWEVVLLCGTPGKKGLGTYLVDKLEEICRRNGIRRLVLTSVFSAVDFYRKKGFRGELEMEKEL